MAMTFLEASTWARDGDVRRGRVDETWHQGRGAYGGIVAAAVLRAMIEDVGDARRTPKSLTLHYTAPATGAMRLRTAVERVGSRVAHCSARVENEGGLVAFGSASFAAARPDAPSWCDARFPDAPAFDACVPVPDDVPSLPAFGQHFEYRLAMGHVPFAGADEARIGGWIAPRVPVVVDAPFVAALLDAYPPAPLARLDTLRPSASVDLTMHFYGADPAASHWLFDARSRIAADGYAEERVELWSSSGMLVGECRQIVALL